MRRGRGPRGARARRPPARPRLRPRRSPARGAGTWPAGLPAPARARSAGTPPTFPEGHRGGALPAGPALHTEAGRRPSASPAARGRLRVPGAGRGRGKGTYLGKGRRVTGGGRNRGEAGSAAPGRASRKPLNPCAPGRPARSQPPRGGETPAGTEWPCLSRRREAERKRLIREKASSLRRPRAVRGLHPWKYWGKFIPF